MDDVRISSKTSVSTAAIAPSAVPYPADFRPLPSIGSRLHLAALRAPRWRVLLVAVAVAVVSLTSFGNLGAQPADAAQSAAVRSASTAWHAAYAASKQQGKKYVYGGAGPNTFDCSGLVQYSYRSAGVRVPRTAQQQYNASRHIRLNQLRVGDVVFFHDSHGAVYHDAIYAGFGAVWNAPHTGARVRVEAVWTKSFYLGRFI